MKFIEIKTLGETRERVAAARRMPMRAAFAPPLPTEKGILIKLTLKIASFPPSRRSLRIYSITTYVRCALVCWQLTPLFESNAVFSGNCHLFRKIKLRIALTPSLRLSPGSGIIHHLPARRKSALCSAASRRPTDVHSRTLPTANLSYLSEMCEIPFARDATQSNRAWRTSHKCFVTRHRSGSPRHLHADGVESKVSSFVLSLRERASDGRRATGDRGSGEKD